MTEDYKKNLLDYVTGNIETGTPTSDEIFKEQIELNRNNWKNYIPNSWANFHIEGVVKDKGSNIYIMYGGYRATGSTGIDNLVYGIIILLDDSFNPFKTFYEYDNGTKLRYIQTMNQAEDGTYYMIDDTIFAFEDDDTILNSQKRLIMLNNFTVANNGEYILRMRTSYICPYNTIKCHSIEKSPYGATYVLSCSEYYDWANTYVGVSIVDFTIPYGDSPTWNRTYLVESVSDNTNRISGVLASTYVYFDTESNFMVKTIASKSHTLVQQGTRTNYVNYYYKSTNSSTYTTTSILNIENYAIISSEYLEYQSLFINNNECYFVLSNLDYISGLTNNLKIYLCHYNTQSNSLDIIFQKNLGTGVSAHQEQIYLQSNEGKLYIQYVVNKGNNTADYYLQRYEGIWNPILIGENKPFVWNQRGFYVNNNYNLLKIFINPVNFRNATWYYKIIKEIYNSIQYNGEPYESKDSLSPLVANLYSNGSLVFSRNLYNISKQNNTTMSSVEIPNTYLNDLTITQNDLISKTNLQMNSNLQSWNKNIYEVVDLNFLNTISIIDEDTGIQYSDSAIKVNNSVTDGGATNYLNTPCNKYRINYTDNTTLIGTLYWDDIDDTHKETKITINVDKAMKSIDFISNDESVVYLNIPLEVEVGNIYSISQKIRID